MTERQSINQIVQVGVETTPGTVVPANKRLTALSIDPKVSTTVTTFRPKGSKYVTLSALEQEWVDATLAGQLTYSEIVYPLSSVITAAATPTELLDTATPTGAYRWTFQPSVTGADSPKTFTVEQGDSATRTHRFTYGIVSALGMTFNRQNLTLSGSMIGRAITDGVAQTASPTLIPLIPVLPTEVDIFLDSTFGAIGTTKLSRVKSATWNLGSRYRPLWVLDSSESSWVTHLEGEVAATSQVEMEADATGMGFLQTLRNGTTKYLRIRCIGPTIYAGAGGRTVTDAVLNSDTSLTSATATFVAGDVGNYISGTGLKPGTRIATRISGTSITLSQPSLITGTAQTVFIHPFEVHNQLTVDMAVKVSNVGSFGDQDGLFGIQFDLVQVDDTAFGRPYQVEVINALTGL